MSGPVGHTYIYNIIIIFIVIVFAFLAGTLSYYKAFKVNNHIVNAIEKFEGYNGLSKAEIEVKLGNIGYQVGSSENCPLTYRGYNLVKTGNEQYRYCIYIDKIKPKKGEFYTYGVLTYMRIDLPLVDQVRVPIFTRTNRIYKFTKD